jgi:hypothetical protein
MRDSVRDSNDRRSDSRDGAVGLAAVVDHGAEREAAGADLEQKLIADGEIIVLEAAEHPLQLLHRQRGCST